MLRLQRLELFGFKSFADPTVMDFGGRSLTGIVGPNGCGKSNVVDAVRWVLGETRPTSMRGAGMIDVIFKGSASRPALNLAEVSLVLDNSGGELEGRGGEVAVTRRLYSSGDSEYLIDGQKVRLKDVRDMLFDTGLGSRGYSVLEQGRIDAVLSANPQQRRTIFEEAAGISRYRQRRHEAELRLKRVEQDLTRLDDVMGELRTRVRSLKIQAGKAERWMEAREEWVRDRRRFLAHRLFLLDGELFELVPELEALATQLGELRDERAAQEAQVEAREEQRSELVAQLDRVSAEVGRLAGELRALEERRRALLERVATWQHSARDEEERAAGLEAELERRRGEIEALTGAATELREQAGAAETAAQEIADRARDLQRAYREARTRVEEQNQAVLESLHERSAAQNQVQHLDQAVPEHRTRLERAEQRLTQADGTLEELRAETERAREASEAAGVELDRAGAEREAAAAAVAGAEKQRAELADERGRAELERAGLSARVEALRDRERQLEELSDGTRRLLSAVESGDGPCDEAGLRGVVADHLSVDTRLARALDAVLGARASALVVRDAHVARRVVDWAREEQVGEVQLVVPPGLGAPPCPAPSDYALFARYGNGVEGRLCDLVRCDPDLRPMARALLCDVVVVHDLDLALRLVGENPEWRFVTPRGDLVDAAGMVGGYREVSQGAVGRRAQAGEYEARIDQLGRELEALALREAAAEEHRRESAAALEAAEEAREAARTARAEADRGRATAEARRKEQESARVELDAECARLRAEVERLAEEHARALEARRATEAAFERENARLEELDGERRGLEQQREELGREASRAEVDLARLKGELSNTEERLSAEQRQVERDGAELERARRRAENFLANATQGAREAEGLGEEERGLEEARTAEQERLEELRGLERQSAAEAQEARRAAEAVQGRLDEVAERQGERRLRQQRLELAREELLGRAHEELELTRQDLKEGFEPESALATEGAMGALEQHVARLKAVLDKLGPVNMEAVNELDEVSERLEFLETQSADLTESRRGLDETIQRIDEESRRLFTDTFDEVRGNFQRIFRLLFGGGKADLVLEEDKDVLEAGIDIVARPPGREMLSIGLLSGGQRTMTALALLFAVFEARPSPFCVLDEVDAALDDANIDRFLGMLDGFRPTTQFIVVTHNKGTMSACDALFGVTMQVKGVSRFVSVELEEVEEFAPETTGQVRAAVAEEAHAGPDPAGPDRESGEPVVELAPAPRARRSDREGSGPETTDGDGSPEDETSDEDEPAPARS